MISRPRFKSHLRIATVPDEGVFVLSSAKQVLLRGRLYSLVIPQMDGKTLDEICTDLAREASVAEVIYTVKALEKKGFIEESQDVVSPADAAWWSMQQIGPQIAAHRLAQTAVAVRGLGIDPDPLRELLKAAGVRLADQSESAATVVVVDHYLRSDLEAINRQALDKGHSWLLIKPLGPQLWLGPLFQPGKTGCWRCLAERLQAHRAVEGYLHRRQTLPQPMLDETQGTSTAMQVGWSLAASSIVDWIVKGELPDCDGKIRTFDQISWNVGSHTLVKLPFCAACGSLNKGSTSSDEAMTNGHSDHHGSTNGSTSLGHPSNGHSHNGHVSAGEKLGHETSAGRNGQANGVLRLHPLILKRQKKVFDRDGGHRVALPEATIARFGHHVSSITGAVSMLERVTPDTDGTMHVYLAGNNLARRHFNVSQLRSDLRNMSAGKGATDIQAKASGLCEGLERYSGVFRGDEPRFRARLSDLDGAGIDVRDCLLFSEEQYRNREAINACMSTYNFVPSRYDPQAEIDWTPVWSLTRRATRFLPTAYCYYDYPHPEGQRTCIACSNGCAAGNTLEEAILQGFFELVERDSVALWWYNRVRRPGVDLASFDEPYIAELQRSLAALGREMHVLDLTSDLGVPVFAAWSHLLGDGPEQILLGFGAHLDVRIAMLRAVTEMTQMMSHLHRNPLDGETAVDVNDAETVHWLQTATAENQPYLKPDSLVPLRKAADFASKWSDDFVDDIEDCQQRVERKGMEMLVLDQTRMEIGLPVVKVIVPGLRHFWARFGPGRLYDIPVELGWRTRPLSESELNPIPMFL